MSEGRLERVSSKAICWRRSRFAESRDDAYDAQALRVEINAQDHAVDILESVNERGLKPSDRSKIARRHGPASQRFDERTASIEELTEQIGVPFDDRGDVHVEADVVGCESGASSGPRVFSSVSSLFAMRFAKARLLLTPT